VAQNNTAWVTGGSIVLGTVMLGCCFCGGAGYFGLMVAARVDQNTKFKGAQEASARRDQLRLIGIAHRNFMDSRRRSASNLDEFQPFVEDGQAVARIRSGEISVVWDAMVPPDQAGNEGKVLFAWENVPDSSGKRAAAFMDGSTAMVGEDELRTALKAESVPH
jgi:hypothetical protein